MTRLTPHVRAISPFRSFPGKQDGPLGIEWCVDADCPDGSARDADRADGVFSCDADRAHGVVGGATVAGRRRNGERRGHGSLLFVESSIFRIVIAFANTPSV